MSDTGEVAIVADGLGVSQLAYPAAGSLARFGAENAQAKLCIASEHRLRSENLAFDIDCWYPRLAARTWPTLFLPLRRRDAEAIARYYQTLHNLKRERNLDNDDVERLDALSERISTVLNERTDIFGKHGAFMRLCGRSPKDADALDRVRVWHQYEQNLAEILTAKVHEAAGTADMRNNVTGADCKRYFDSNPSALRPDPNDQLLAIARTTSVLQVRKAEDAMSLLLTSERVYADMLDWLHYGEPEQICLRMFDPDLTLEWEFRAFISEDKLTAISQYDHYGVYIELLQPEIERIHDGILAEWKLVHGLVGEQSYCMDFGWIDGRARLIELSPFLRCTGPALFSWDDDAELLAGTHILPLDVPFDCTTGRFVKNGVEFRINVRERTNMDELIVSNWDCRWSRPQINDFRELLSLYRKGSKNCHDDTSSLSFMKKVWTGVSLPIAEWWRKESVLDRNSSSASDVIVQHNDSGTLLFVYGTLKSGFHWNSKFLGIGARLEAARATTVDPQLLVVGASGVPYMLLPSAEDPIATRKYHVVGEVWRVDDEVLDGLDEYEGVGKDYYVRDTIEVNVNCSNGNEQVLCAQVYRRRIVSGDAAGKLLQQQQPLAEYTLGMHRELYSAIRHILVKQNLYLGVRDDQS